MHFDPFPPWNITTNSSLAVLVLLLHHVLLTFQQYILCTSFVLALMCDQDVSMYSKAALLQDWRQILSMACANTEVLSLDKALPSIITGKGHITLKDGCMKEYCCNITIEQSSGLMLQRFAPFSLDNCDKTAISAKESCALLNEVYLQAKSKNHSASSWQKKTELFLHYHFGAWYDVYMIYLTLTSKMLQASKNNEKGREAVGKFCTWFKSFKEGFWPVWQVSTEACQKAQTLCLGCKEGTWAQ